MVHSLPHRIFKYSGHLSYIFTVFELKSLDKLKHPYQKIPQLIQIILSNNTLFKIQNVKKLITLKACYKFLPEKYMESFLFS